MEPTIIKPGMEHWDTFISRLRGHEGCNFRKASYPFDETFECDSTFRFSKKILAQMAEKWPSNGLDIEGTIDWFRSQGHMCDCQVILKLGKKKQ